MRTVQLRIKDVNDKIKEYGIEFSKRDLVQLIDEKIIVVNKEPSFFYYQTKLIPTLKLFLKRENILKKVIIDIGAIKFIINGADIMRPGITEIDLNIKKEEIIAIIDEKNHKPIAIGIALYNAEEMNSLTSGKVIKNIHYVGDEIWKIQI